MKPATECSKTPNFLEDELETESEALPLGVFEEYSPVDLTSLEGFTCIVADVHFPFHDRDFLKTIFKHAKTVGIKRFIVNGDCFDFHKLSRFKKYKKPPGVEEEISLGVQFFEAIRSNFPRAEVFFKEGNHDERLDNYLIEKAPELSNLSCLELPSLLGLPNLGVRYVKGKRGIKLDGLLVMHGHEYTESRAIPKHPAETALNNAHQNILVGHHHVTDHFHKNPTHGQQIHGYTIGCCSNLNPEWCRNNRWNHGFALVEHFKYSRQFRVHNLQFYEGKII